MVKKSSGVTKATDLNGATVCVQPGTTTELNLNDYFRTKKMTFKPVVIAELNQIEQAFLPAAAMSTPPTSRAWLPPA